MDMLGPGSLRSQQPLRPSLKTYGRSKKSLASTASSSNHTAATEGHARLFDWTRLENERRAQYDAMLSARKAAKASSRRAEALLYNDLGQPESTDDLDDIEMPRRHVAQHNNNDSMALDLGLNYNEHESISYSESTSEHTKRHKHRPKFKDSPEIIPSSHTSESDDNNDENGDPFSPVYMTSRDSKQSQKQHEPQHLQKTMGYKHPSLAPEKNFTELEQQQEEEELELEQELEQTSKAPDLVDIVNEPVLFRPPPSIDIRQRLLSIPRPRFSKPQANTFSHVIGDISRENSSSPTRLDTSHSFQNPAAVALSESLSLIRTPPRSWKEQTADLRRFRSGDPHPPSRTTDYSTPNISLTHNTQPTSQSRLGTGSSREGLTLVSSQDVSNSPSLQEGSARSQSAGSDVPSTPKKMSRAIIDLLSDAESDQEQRKNEGLDFSLGKRMSTIQITPQRMQAKLPRTSSSSPPSPPNRLAISPMILKGSKEGSKPQSKQLKLFLDRDIPEDEKDDVDFLFESSRTKKVSELQRSGKNQDRFVSSLVGSGRLPFPQRGHRSHSTQTARQDPFGLSSPCRQDTKTLPILQEPKKNLKGPPPIPTLPVVLKQAGAAQPSTLVQQTQKDTITATTKQQQIRNHGPVVNAPLTRPKPQNRSLRKPPSTVSRTLPSVSKPPHAVAKPPSTVAKPRPSVPKPVGHTNTSTMEAVGDVESMRAESVEQLLEICNQGFFDQFRLGSGHSSTMSDQVLDFESVIPSSMIQTLSKIGEASYSEVFTIDIPSKDSPSCSRPAELDPPEFDKYVRNFRRDANTLYLSRGGKKGSSGESIKKIPLLTMKVIPFIEGAGQSSGSTGKSRSKNAALADMDILGLQDIYRETMVSTQVIHDWSGFIGSFGAMIVKGKYPQPFLNAWDRYRKEFGTESVRPHVFKEDQLYCIIMLPYGGMDLEHYPVNNWQQAWTVLAQVAGSLQAREQGPSWFEHRDLHWGNVLVKETHFQTWSFPMGKGGDVSRGGSQEYSIPTFGITTLMIDFTLARVQGDKGGLIYMDMEKDTDLFRGQGDCQFDVYRKMRKLINKDWSASDPRTNVFWLHYIAEKLLLEKELEPPASRSALFETTTKGSSKVRKKKAMAKSQPTTSHTTTPQETGRDLFEEQWDETRFTEEWCFDRIWAVSQLNMDRFEQWAGSSHHLQLYSASGAVLQLLLDLA
ncbi:MAG: hypothetical protein BYD32DRAFT_410592 [Podila humilis]|nr:MAG: hypothetical protein BYD32DRAFT_410592 [Podila humilis]